METIVSSEKDFEDYTQPFPEGLLMYHFKMVSVGPNTQALADRLGNKICNIVRSQQGFFLIGDNVRDLREAMHALVDRFCDSQEK